MALLLIDSLEQQFAGAIAPQILTEELRETPLAVVDNPARGA
jgi:hypothetical protein